MTDKNKKTRSLGDLVSIIGNVSENHKNELEMETANFVNDTKSKPNTNNKIEKTMEFKITNIQGIQIQSRVRKIQESFRIKPSLKKMVEEIVTKSEKNGQKITRGEVYNLLIAIGLKNLGE